jgi:hypothetical protein
VGKSTDFGPENFLPKKFRSLELFEWLPLRQPREDIIRQNPLFCFYNIMLYMWSICSNWQQLLYYFSVKMSRQIWSQIDELEGNFWRKLPVGGQWTKSGKKREGFCWFFPPTDKYCHTIEKLPPGNSWKWCLG